MARPRSILPRRALSLLALTVAANVFAAVGGFAATETAARPFVSPIFGDHMVLQRGKPNTFWGWTEPGAEVRVTVDKNSATARAGTDGRWSAKIDPPPAGGPYIVIIDGPQRVELRDVLVGDVWLCGGQSNMEMGLAAARNGAEEVRQANQPQIRFFRVQPQVAYSSADVPQGSWKVCAPENVGGWPGLSAVGYFFARRVREDIDVPIGLIQNALGGTPAESWTSREALREFPEFQTALDEIARLEARGGPQHGNYVSHWYDEFDPGQKDQAWFQPELDETGWKDVTLVDGFRALGVPETPAVVYFRREVALPDPLPAGTARILLGIVERMDTTFINGTQVGASAWVENPRAYRIPENVLRPGANQITIRVLKTKPDGGFRSPPEALKLVLGDGTEIPLAGTWRGKLAVDARPPHPLPMGYENWPVMPTVLYNGMLRPIAPFAITGALWYQGEANADRPQQYRTLLPAMIADWRRLFEQGDFPFYLVSLAAFMERQEQPGDPGWAELRAAQDFVAQTVPNSGLALAIDVGNAEDIHPIDKKEVGERLALHALAKHYGKDVVYSGPRFASMDQLPSALRLHFTHTEGGLVARDGKLEEFSICGSDRVWHWAHAKIVGDTIILSSSEVRYPVAARYAWQSNPRATLYNGAGLPAVPFETDAGEFHADAPGSNPLFRDAFTADPAPLVVGDTLYLYVGHDEARGEQMFNITEWLCYSTKDMKHWTAHGPIMKPTDFTWATGEAWASQVVEKDGKFYFYTTVQHGPPHVGKSIGVAVADHPLGPFRDARGTALVRDDTTPSDKPWNDIDPTVFIDDDGTAYLAWGNPYLYFARLKPNMIEIDGAIERIDLPNYTEGPWLHKRGNKYYLTYAAFAHQGMWEKICYATAPRITGPWTYRGILTDQTKTSYTIHPGIVEFQGKWYLFYHNADLVLHGEAGGLGRRSVCVEYLYYNPDGTLVPVRQTKEGVSVPPIN